MRAEGVADLRIRGHHLLCMLGFRGEGYSGPFVDNMRRVVDAFFGKPHPLVRVVAEPDVICTPCPHLREGCCTAEDGADGKTRSMDAAVLAAMGLQPGTLAASRTLLDLVRRHVDDETQARICTGCRWLPKGFCAEGLARLRRES